MARGDDLVLKVRGDASTVASDLAPATKGLDAISKEAKEASTDLAKLASTKVTPSVHAEAIAKAKADIARLRDEMAKKIAVGADTTAAQKEIAKLERAIRALEGKPIKPKVDTSDIKKAGADLGDLTGGAQGFLSKFGPGGAVVGAVAGAGVAFVKMAADMETAQLQMKFLVRDGGNVKQLIADIQRYGATSPFEFPELLKSTQMLLGFGVASKDAVRVLKDLGEVSAATQAPIEDLARIYGQMFAKGTVSAEQMIQFAERGVPAWEALAVALGKTVPEVQELAEQGKLGRKEIELMGKALGESFSGATAAQAKTLNGQLSTLTDNLKQAAVAIGELFLPNVTQATTQTNDFASHLTQVTDVLKWLRDNSGTTPFWSDKLEEQAIKDAAALKFSAEQLEAFNILLSQGVPAQQAFDSASKGTAVQLVKIREAAQAAGKPIVNVAKDAKVVWDQYADAIAGANSELDKQIKNLGILNGRYLDVRQASSDYQESIDAINDAMAETKLDENGNEIKVWTRTMDDSTEAGRKNIAMLDEMSTSAVKLAEARLADAASSGESTDQILKDLETQKAGIIATGEALGLSHEEAVKYADTMVHIPPDVATNIQLMGVQKALDDKKKITDPAVLSVDVQLMISEATKRKLAQFEFEAGTSPTTGTGSRSATQSAAPTTVEYRPRIYLDGQLIASYVLTGVSTMATSAARQATQKRRL